MPIKFTKYASAYKYMFICKCADFVETIVPFKFAMEVGFRGWACAKWPLKHYFVRMVALNP